MLKLEELQVYNLSMLYANDVYNLVIKWDYFSKDTIGKQWVRSADSIAANISEGFGRYFFKENKLFCYYSRGSLMESKTWLNKAYQRKLISEEEFTKQTYSLSEIHQKLNSYIKSIGRSQTLTSKSMTNDQ